MSRFVPIPAANYKFDYVALFRAMAEGKIDKIATFRDLCKKDLFFLLHWGLNRQDVNHPFIVNAIREVEEDHYNTLDLWAREHYKSTVLTYALPLQELILNPEERIGIFSHTRGISKGFLRQIKHTLENDVPLKRWFTDIFWAKPTTQAPLWSENDGLVMKRKSHAKEASIEAWGLVDGQPTSKHFTIRVYDDVVTRESVTTSEQIRKTLEAYELSQSLGTDGGSKRVVGTHYHFADLYSALRKKDGYKLRIKPATHDGTPTGEPVLLSSQRLADLRKEQGPYIYACQQLLNPVATECQTFQLEWVQTYGTLPSRLNKYLLCDPANEKKATSDYTVMAVIGLDAAGNYFLLDMIRDRLNLTERWKALRDLWQRNQRIRNVGYEKYGMQADITYFQERQREEGVYFPITPLGGQTSKIDRVQRLVPLFETGRFWLPPRIIYNNKDLVKALIDEELTTFPFCIHDDMLDCLARIEDADLGATSPAEIMPDMAAMNAGASQYHPLHW